MSAGSKSSLITTTNGENSIYECKAGVSLDDWNGEAVWTHPRHQPAATWVNTTRYCEYSQVAPDDGRKHCPKHVELTRNNKITCEAVSTHPWHQPAATWVNTTRYCGYSQVAPDDGRKHCPKHIELTRNNKLTFIVASFLVTFVINCNVRFCFVMFKTLISKF